MTFRARGCRQSANAGSTSRFDFGQLALIVVFQHNHPIIDIFRPVAIGQEFVGVRAKLVQKFRHLAVMPGDEDGAVGFASREPMRQGLHFLVGKGLLDLEPARLREGGDRQARAVAVLRIRGRDNRVDFHRRAIDPQMLEIIYIGLGACYAGGRETRAAVVALRLFRMANNEQRIAGEAGGRDIVIVIVMMVMMMAR